MKIVEIQLQKTRIWTRTPESKISEDETRFKKEKKKNAKLLENNRQLVLEKDRLKSHIQMLQ